MNFRFILFSISFLLMIMAATMLIPMAIDLAYGDDDWKTFLTSAFVTGFAGITLYLSNRSCAKDSIRTHEAFLVTVLSWVAVSVAGAIPFYLSDLNLGLANSVFESVSGITTTGSTILTNIDNTPPGILFWRAILQWLGGIGIIVMALSVMPFLNVGGMQLFRAESSENEKSMPKAGKFAANITAIYVGLTILCFLGYIWAGLDSFDAIAHAFTTIATGGYSTHDLSLGFYSSPWPSVVAIIFMLAGGMPFILYLQGIYGNLSIFFKDTQVQWFLSIVAIIVAITFLHLVTSTNTNSLIDNLRLAAFNVTSLITGTGYSTADYMQWGPVFIGLAFFVMVIGGCAGSTTCGIKIFRLQVLYAIANAQIKRLIYPHGMFVARYNGKTITQSIEASVLSFFFLYALSFTVLAVLLSMTGLDFITSMSGAATSISNVGPGLGDIIGPSGTFAPLPDASKWLLCVGMLLGRLELFTVLVLLSPHFWKR